jgi:hypothetical protein
MPLSLFAVRISICCRRSGLAQFTDEAYGNALEDLARKYKPEVILPAQQPSAVPLFPEWQHR